MKNLYKKHPWKITEDSFDPLKNQISESIFSIGNGRMGQRANFEEHYSGQSLQGSYIGGVYYPDKTKVGWWKNGYPEYFAKVLNSVNWIGIKLKVNDKKVDLARVEITDFHRVLDMKKGLLSRSCTIKIDKKTSLKIRAERFYSMVDKDIALLQYSVTNLGKKCKVELSSFIDGAVTNHDTNYDEIFWNFEKSCLKPKTYWLQTTTKKTEFSICAAQQNKVLHNDKPIVGTNYKRGKKKIGKSFTSVLKKGDNLNVTKYTCICSTLYFPKKELRKTTISQLKKALKKDFTSHVKSHADIWQKKWDMMDVSITGDTGAQQGIRYNIFQLHQTYTGEDTRLNIGPKGFTGEKYGGSTYWDTEAYCLPFYMGTSDQSVSRSLLEYRHNQLAKAIDNAKKLGFNKGAALYPMVTMNGEECHNEWEITFEEIHRNGAIAYAIHDYKKYYGNDGYLAEKGIDVLIGIARFWAQRVTWSTHKSAYVILGVTGPNEYENNVDNNWYTNYIAQWCLNYSAECYNELVNSKALSYSDLSKRLKVSKKEVESWKSIASKMYLPKSTKLGIFLQQENYLDKEQVLVSDLKKEDRPINQNWSWDRILRSPYIKQADVLQGLYFFEENFTKKTIEKNFNYYEPRTVHESSLSPCVHSILASSLGNEEKAYEMYLRTARLDLDNYNNDTEDGLHITSMAGSWLAVIKGFAGMRIHDDLLSFKPILPQKWKSYNFKIKHQKQTVVINVTTSQVILTNESEEEKWVKIYNRRRKIAGNTSITVTKK